VVGNVTNEIVGVEVVVGAGISVTQNKCIHPILFIYVQRGKCDSQLSSSDVGTTFLVVKIKVSAVMKLQAYPFLILTLYLPMLPHNFILSSPSLSSQSFRNLFLGM
jgi:hypothetical protein